MLSRCRPGHLFALLFLLYVTADLMDPSTPGAFSFEADPFFVDGVVRCKADVVTIPTPVTTSPFSGIRVTDDQRAAPREYAVTRLLALQRVHWKNQKHDICALFASTSPPDSEPAPLQS
jgi:hypothetical protein